MTDIDLEREQRLTKALNKLAKWRSVFAGWQLGTRPDGDPESKAIRDHRELSLFLRIEANALTSLLLEKGVFTLAEFQETMIQEAGHYEEVLERKFPGFKASDVGMDIDLEKVQKHGTMDGWRP